MLTPRVFAPFTPPRSTARLEETLEPPPCRTPRPTDNKARAINHIIDLYRMKLRELANLTEEFSMQVNAADAKSMYRTMHQQDKNCVQPLLVSTPRVTTPRYLCTLHNKALPPIRSHTEDTLPDVVAQRISFGGDDDSCDNQRVDRVNSNPEKFGSEREESSDSSGPDMQKASMVNLTTLTPKARAKLSKLYAAEFRVKDEWENGATNPDCLQRDLAARSAHLQRTVSRSKTDASASSQESFGASRSLVSSDMQLYTKIETESNPVCRRMVSSPASPPRIAWELLGIALILYDTFSIPLVLAFDIEASTFSAYMDWFLRLFWSLNIAVVLTTGFIRNGVLVMSSRSILFHYCKTWLVVDVITVIPDWLFLLLSHMTDEDDNEGSDTGSLVRLVRFLRILRIARLMRMTKLRDAYFMILDTIDSERLGILFGILNNVFVVLLLTHYMACLWFAVGSAQPGKSWLKYHRLTKGDGVMWHEQFFASYHWSVTQFASSVDLYAQSSSERVFAIGMVIFGMIGFSYIVANITSSLTRLRALNERRATSFWMLRKFLVQKQVPRELCIRIRSYVESQWERMESQMSAKNIDSLGLLSEKLKSDLACAINGPSLSIHPLFAELHANLAGTTQRLMHSGISELSLAPLDTMFSAGEDATHMSIVTQGTMQYERMHLETCYPEVVESQEDWIAEQVLWISGWYHLGDLTATTATELLQVNADKLMAIARLNPLAFTMLSAYSKKYADWLNEIGKELLSDISQGEDVSGKLREMVTEIEYTYGMKLRKDRNSLVGVASAHDLAHSLGSAIRDLPHSLGSAIGLRQYHP